MNPRGAEAGRPLGDSLYDAVLLTPRFQLLLVLAFAAFAFFSKLDGHGLANYDDCIYAQQGKEILATGNWLTIHIEGRPVFDTPPLFPWLVTLSYKIFGVGEYAARFPSALGGLLAVAVTYLLARRLFSPWVGFFSAFALATTIPFTRYARHALRDVPLAFLVCLAILALVLALQKDRRYFLLWGVSIAACLAMKSILGLLPLAISGLYILAARKWSVLREPYFWLGNLLLTVVGLAWYAHQYWLHGQAFVEGHFVQLIWSYGVVKGSHSWGSHLYYLQELATGYWPWLPFSLIGGVKLWKAGKGMRDERTTLLLLWVMVYLVGLSLAGAKNIRYLLPLFPATAVLSGYALDQLLAERGKRIFVRGAALFTVIGALVVNATPLPLSSEREVEVRVLAPYVKHFVDQGARVIASPEVHFNKNNALLFYSDHGATPVKLAPKRLQRAFAGSGLVLCLVRRAEVPAVSRSVPEARLVREAGELVLLANRELDIRGIKTW